MSIDYPTMKNLFSMENFNDPILVHGYNSFQQIDYNSFTTSMWNLFQQKQESLYIPLSNFNNDLVASPQSLQINQNRPIEITLQTNSDIQNSLQVIIISSPLHGFLSKIDQNNGKVTYTPQMDYSGHDEFTFRITNGNTYSNTAKISIEIIKNSNNNNPTKSLSSNTKDKINDASANEVHSDKKSKTNSGHHDKIQMPEPKKTMMGISGSTNHDTPGEKS